MEELVSEDEVLLNEELIELIELIELEEDGWDVEVEELEREMTLLVDDSLPAELDCEDEVEELGREMTLLVDDSLPAGLDREDEVEEL